MADHPIPQILRIFLFQPQPVILLILIPLFQPDDKIYILRIPHAGNTKQRFNIHNTDTPQFYKMLRNIRRGTYQRLIADLAYLHHIIRHKAMPPLNKFQCCLRLSDTAFPRNQHPFAEHVHQHSMHRNTRSQFHIQPTDNLRHKCRSSLFSHQYRNLIGHCRFEEQSIRLQFPAENNGRNLTG